MPHVLSPLLITPGSSPARHVAPGDLPLQIFDVNKLDLMKVGKSFGFRVPPNVNLGK